MLDVEIGLHHAAEDGSCCLRAFSSLFHQDDYGDLWVVGGRVPGKPGDKSRESRPELPPIVADLEGKHEKERMMAKLTVTIEPTSSKKYANVVIRRNGESRRFTLVTWEEAETKAAELRKELNLD